MQRFNARLPFVVSFFCVLIFAGAVVASPDYSPFRDAVPFAPGAASSNLIPAADNTYDIGSTSLGWKDLHLEGQLIFNPSNSSSTLSILSNASTSFGFWFGSDGRVFARGLDSIVTSGANQLVISNAAGTAPPIARYQSRGRLRWPEDGKLELSNDAGTDFGMLQFGGTTSSFPALKRNGSDIELKSGDDANYRDIFLRNSYHHNNAGAIRIRILTNIADNAMVDIGSAGVLGWGSAAIPGGTPDTRLTRAAASVLQLSASSAGSGASLELFESASAPAAPAANGVRIFAKDDGGGKTQLCARFATGAEQCFATEP